MTTSNSIYKVNLLTNENTINSIHVFYGNNYSVGNNKLNETFLENPNNELFLNIFDNDELNYIKKNNVKVVFSQQEIHPDDSIAAIKIKIMEEFSNTFSLEEMYLFAVKEEMLNSINIYQSLKQKKINAPSSDVADRRQNNRMITRKIELTKPRLMQFLSNIVNDNSCPEPIHFDLLNKATYSYDDIVSLNLTDKKYLITKALGQKYSLIDNEYPFISNPFVVEHFDELIEKYARKSLTSLNSNLLMNTGKIHKNNIYLCLAEDVLENIKKRNLSEQICIKIYYPTLFKDDVFSLNLLNNKRQILIERSLKQVNDSTFEMFSSVDLFYDVYKERKEELNYKTSGIKYIKLVIHPTYEIKIPLDVIFKIVHAERNKPLVKFNPAIRRQENIFRIYTDKIAKDGRKIPFLTKADINTLMKVMGKGKSVSVYIQHQYDRKKYNKIFCEFEENGNIQIECEFEQVLNTEQVNEIFKLAVNPVIDEVKTYIEKSGYTINLFNNIYDDNVSIKQMTYETSVQIKTNIKIDDLIGCVSSVFLVESKNFKKGIEMRFKRVSNFNKTTSQEAFIIEQIDNKVSGIDIIKGLIENYKMSEPEARELLSKYASELEVEKGARKSDTKVKINPGFKTTVALIKNTDIVTITVDNINDIQYLETLPIYLDSLVRLSQSPSSTAVPSKIIQKLCNTGAKKDIILKDVVSSFSEEKTKSSSSSLSSIKSFTKTSSDKVESEEQYQNFVENEEENEERVNNAFDLLDLDLIDMGDDESNELLGGSSSSDSGEVLDINEIVMSSNSPQEQEIIAKESSSILEPTVKTKKERKSKKTKIQDIVATNDESVKNLDGMSIKNPNYFETKLYDNDSALFLKKEQGKYNPYGKTCATNARKTPVVLTPDEFNKINKEKPDFFKEGDVLKYGSTPENENYYICPRYWCLKTSMPIDPSEIVEELNEKGHLVKRHPTCGEVIPRNADKVPPGAYIYEFFDPKEHVSQDNDKYVQHYPGFVKEGKHPEGLCIPCCYKNWDTKEHIVRKEKCANQNLKQGNLLENEEVQKEEIAPSISEKEEVPKKTKKVIEKEDYVMAPEKFPLDPQRWGYLPLSIQYFLHENNADCQISKTNTNIRLNHTCLLRHGIEENENQSFIAVIADALYYSNVNKVPTIKEMKEIMISALNIDDYLSYQNGNLFISFNLDDIEQARSTDYQEYQNSKIYNIAKNSENLDYFNKIVTSFENFKAFLRDDTVMIDYTYLWDFISKPNPKLFEQGINLVILEINEFNESVNFVCPTSHYSTEIYKATRPTLMIIKKGNYYEPIYSYRNEEKKLKVTQTFTEMDPKLPKSIRALFKKIIRPLMLKTCLPLESMPNKYNFKHPIILGSLIAVLNKLEYTIINQVVNFENKVIGVVCQDLNAKKGFVPSYPSAINYTYPYVLMNEDDLFISYRDTIQFLNNLYNKSKGTVKSRPMFKVVEGDTVVGLLTETNQFVQINNYEKLSSIKDNLDELEYNDYYDADKKTLLSNDADMERIEVINKIKIETNLYNAFRNTIRILLNDFKNLNLREKIEEEIKSPYILYNEKLRNINAYLRELVDDKIKFVKDYEYNEMVVSEISTCIMNEESKCFPNTSCQLGEDGVCKLTIPKQNLINEKNNNEIFYYDKMADELIRYNRIKTFLFQPQTYLSFGTLGYNLRDDEIILIQSLLDKEYFEGLVPAVINKYVKNNNYDDVEPLESQVYDNNMKLNNQLANIQENEVEGVDIIKEKISSTFWKKCFPSTFNELIYDDKNKKENITYSGFYMLSDLIKLKTSNILSTNQIRLELLQEYFKYLSKYEVQIVDILISEGKKTLGDQVKGKTMDFTHFIYNEDYYITNFDVWLILEKYKIPSVFISSKSILQANNQDKVFVAYGEKEDNFCFIVTPLVKIDTAPKYKLIQNTEDSVVFPLNVINDSCVDSIINAFDNKLTVEEFIQTFTRENVVKKRKPVAKKRNETIIIEREEDDPILQIQVESEDKKENTKTKKQRNRGVVFTKKNKKRLLVIEDDE
jgi:hypothetical protein